MEDNSEENHLPVRSFGTVLASVENNVHVKIIVSNSTKTQARDEEQRQVQALKYLLMRNVQNRACRHGDRCSRLHNRPTISPTLLLSNMYQRPDMITPGVDAQGQPIDPQKIQEHFEDFYEDIFEELGKFGEIESLNVCDNLADHMIGNVYVQFREEQAAAALQALQGRFYSGRPIIADFSPVTDFREATCRQYEENNCNRGGYCNFMHVKLIGRDLRRKLFGRYRGYRVSRSRSRSMSPRHRRDRDNDRREKDYRDRDRDYRGNGRRSGDRHDRYDRDGARRRHGSPRRSRSPVREGVKNAEPGLNNGTERGRRSSEGTELGCSY
ncbi:hypothetical protein GH714_017424 [Hevea brasiliensis]|uniref:Uncharacterized protein n=1 Tax=Hevea brasiliensis TaxID=3981 RepID=A0A6A6MAP7_HEVBR|nr:hypothetical protein GH714_017424 [Hevea brasiliensis]